MASSRTNEDWKRLITSKIDRLQSPNSESHNSGSIESDFTAIVSPNDPKLPLAIDHTLLKPDATNEQVDELCREARKWGFKSCCVNGSQVNRVVENLRGTSVIACAVVGFPLGAGTSKSKAFEASQAIEDGAQEVDMVINVGALKSKDYNLVYEDIKAVTEVAHISSSSKILVKVILETISLTNGEIMAASYIAAEAGADYVKTSTGFLGGGATEEHVGLMRRSVAYKDGDEGGERRVKVKASGGVRTFESCVKMFKAGAERIGTSSGIAIMESRRSDATY
ncbi:deoxyribose-phosphate aldolase [Pluteus cervinus]|uniref:Deoxyribose-phosphate aldolase n=1 Tax=Pluteus cervinus TaxID=181527 RepID=A0ACD2ZY63_9AGAR|nr:deoxyribose-phosphate aldolase [Pluteus cervinus]